MLVTNGADVPMRDEGGKSALTFAEERGHKDLADHLRGLGLTA
jgi:ankyrin repeat protein